MFQPTKFADATLPAKRLSLGGSSDVIPVSPSQFHLGGLSHKILGMIEANFLPGSPSPAPVVLDVRNWETGAVEHRTAYEVRTTYGRTFKNLATIGSQLANWVWLLVPPWCPSPISSARRKPNPDPYCETECRLLSTPGFRDPLASLPNALSRRTRKIGFSQIPSRTL